MNDGRQGISFDRWLIRIKDLLQIITTVGALLWGALQFVRTIDRLEMKIELLQQQNSRTQQIVTGACTP